MKISIKSKLIGAISLLIILLFSLSAYLLINQKKNELAVDIFEKSISYGKLVAPKVIDYYDDFLSQNSFVYFNREIQKLFGRNDDISRLMIISYAGEIIYDSIAEQNKAYSGKKRLLDDPVIFNQIRSKNISFSFLDDDKKVFYIQQNDSAENPYSDFYDNKYQVRNNEVFFIKNLVLPVNERYSVLFEVDYHNLDERIAEMMRKIIYLALFGIMVGVIFSILMSTHLTKPIKKLVQAVGDIGKGNFDVQVKINTNDEINYLGNEFNNMASQLKESLVAKLYQERVMRELELSKDIQKQIIPKDIPKINALDIAAGLIPAEEIGGDMYDFLPVEVGDNRKYFMYLGDVTGHGVPSGIVSSIASALFYAFKNYSDLQRIMIEVNRVLKAKTMPNMFMTLCLLMWDEKNEKMSYVSAGHEQIIHFDNKNKQVFLEPAGGIALGMIENIEPHLAVREIELQSGDFLVVYSDGIPEAWKNKKENYGMEKFQKSVQSFGDLATAAAIKEAIMADVKEFMAGYPQLDDITLMVIKKC